MKIPDLFIALAGTPFIAPHVRAQENPNIIIVFMDDMGYGDIASNGAVQYNTPNIDHLAASGMRFTNFYAAQAVSSASRAGLMTGCYPNRIGITGALNPTAQIGLNKEEETIPEILKKRGYKTAAVGKWHLGHHREFLPLQHGFDEYFGLPYSNDMWPVGYDGSRNFSNKNARKSKFPELPLIEGNPRATCHSRDKDIGRSGKINHMVYRESSRFYHQKQRKSIFLILGTFHAARAISRFRQIQE